MIAAKIKPIVASIPKPTARQRELCRTVLAFTRANEFPPTVSELAQALGISKTTCYRLATESVRRGVLSYVPGLARSWRVTDQQAVLAADKPAKPRKKTARGL